MIGERGRRVHFRIEILETQDADPSESPSVEATEDQPQACPQYFPAIFWYVSFIEDSNLLRQQIWVRSMD
jgi:hypothetical protein